MGVGSAWSQELLREVASNLLKNEAKRSVSLKEQEIWNPLKVG
jgi:hypothetical protein